MGAECGAARVPHGPRIDPGRVAGGLSCRVGVQHLAGSRERDDARRNVHGAFEPVGAAANGAAGVQPDPHVEEAVAGADIAGERDVSGCLIAMNLRSAV